MNQLSQFVLPNKELLKQKAEEAIYAKACMFLDRFVNAEVIAKELYRTTDRGEYDVKFSLRGNPGDAFIFGNHEIDEAVKNHLKIYFNKWNIQIIDINDNYIIISFK